VPYSRIEYVVVEALLQLTMSFEVKNIIPMSASNKNTGFCNQLVPDKGLNMTVSLAHDFRCVQTRD
jgi:hypothetical protein